MAKVKETQREVCKTLVFIIEYRVDPDRVGEGLSAVMDSMTENGEGTIKDVRVETL